MMYPYFRAQCPAGSVPYTIRAGDTLVRIATEYNTTVQDILRSNPGINPYYLMIGQQICVPLTVQLYPSCPTTNYYVVRMGDSLQSIANYFGVSYDQLYYSNYGIDPNGLYEDQILCIPVAPSPVNLVVAVGENSLTVYYKGTSFKTYPIGKEDPNSRIPRGTFTVLNKQVDTGEETGARWLGLSEAGFGIRGVNNPEFINVLSSGKSIVLSNTNASELFNLVPVGTSVRIS